MPANERAVRLTDAYRGHARTLRARAQDITRASWQVMGDDLDATQAHFVHRAAPALLQLQRTGARLSAGYLAAYVAASHGKPPVLTGASAASDLVGQSRAGKPLTEALAGPVIAVKVALSRGRPLDEALALGRTQAVRDAGEDVMHVTRGALFAGIAHDGDIVGWRRVTNGGCGACLALADGTIYSDEAALEVHDGCQCTGEPVVRDVPDTVLRPTGEQIFTAMSLEEQDQLLGPDKAHIVRDGQVPFHALVARSPMEAIPDQVTEAPLEALHAH